VAILFQNALFFFFFFVCVSVVLLSKVDLNACGILSLGALFIGPFKCKSK